MVPLSRKDMQGGKGFAAPVVGVVVLIACYWVLAEWNDLPTLIDDALAAVHWPG